LSARVCGLQSIARLGVINVCMTHSTAIPALHYRAYWPGHQATDTRRYRMVWWTLYHGLGRDENTQLYTVRLRQSGRNRGQEQWCI